MSRATHEEAAKAVSTLLDYTTLHPDVAANQAKIAISYIQQVEMSKQAINIIFDGPPGPKSGRFIEIETDSGRSLNVGEWIERPDGMWALRIEHPQPMTDLSQREHG